MYKSPQRLQVRGEILHCKIDVSNGVTSLIHGVFLGALEAHSRVM
jgi:hypothetical protein